MCVVSRLFHEPYRMSYDGNREPNLRVNSGSIIIATMISRHMSLRFDYTRSRKPRARTLPLATAVRFGWYRTLRQKRHGAASQAKAEVFQYSKIASIANARAIDLYPGDASYVMLPNTHVCL